jgi:hypothetical protein
MGEWSGEGGKKKAKKKLRKGAAFIIVQLPPSECETIRQKHKEMGLLLVALRPLDPRRDFSP